jgi:hypothetical protein
VHQLQDLHHRRAVRRRRVVPKPADTALEPILGAVKETLEVVVFVVVETLGASTVAVNCVQICPILIM